MPRFRFPRVASLVDVFNRSSSVLLLFVLIFTFARHFTTDARDPYKCEALVRDGQWHSEYPESTNARLRFQNWQPPACILHNYQAPEIASCARGGKILFVGDATIRHIYWETARKVDRGHAEELKAQKEFIEQHTDLIFTRNGATLKFIWDPFLNSTEFYEELRAYRTRADPTLEEKSYEEDAGESGNAEPRRSVVILVGGGLSHARHIKIGALKYFEDAVDNVTATAYPHGAMANARNLPMSSDEGIGDQILFAPILEPRYDRLSPAREATITPEKITQMNDYLEQLSLHQGLNVLWSYRNMTAVVPEAYGESGLHVVENVAARMADVALNLRCNAKAARRDGYPYDRTCCNDYNPINWIQVIGFLCTIAITPLVILRAVKKAKKIEPTPVDKSPTHRPSRSTLAVSAPDVTTAVFFILLSACYSFVTDRTQVLNKVERLFTSPDHALLSVIAFVVGVSTMRGASALPNPRRAISNPESSKDSSFLSRDQAQEWKGWMQLFILTYAYTGAHDQLEIYEVLRLVLASYLFLTGYGHSMHLLKTNDYSLHRAATVLVRINLLPVCLSYMARTSYTFYYFAPLVSVWFLVLMATLKARHQRNDSLLFLIGKIVASAIITTGLIHVHGPLESISFILRNIFRIDFSASAWRYYLGLDKYMVFVGAIVAILHLRISAICSRSSAPRASGKKTFADLLKKYFPVLRILITLLAVIIPPVFWLVTRRSPDKEDYNWWMPYISFLPIVSFVVLRNATHALRHIHSASLAWLGRISLELYVLSHHTLLAGDGKGLLSTGLFHSSNGTIISGHWKDLLLLGTIFVWLAWRAHAATSVLTALIVGEQEPLEEREGRLKVPDIRLEGRSVSPLPSPSVTSTSFEKAKRKSIWPVDMKSRMLVVGAVLWFLNLTYV